MGMGRRKPVQEALFAPLIACRGRWATHFTSS
jgi:hypothetical protein